MKFGAFVFHNTQNLGDEIQTLAAMRFLPRVDHFIDRDALGRFHAEEPVSLILNGWYGHRPESWPPSESIEPLLVSMHLSPIRGNGLSRIAADDFFLREPAVEYLRRHGPVGARDLHTLSVLEAQDVPAYFSGCMTLTLQVPTDTPRGSAIVLNDVPDELILDVRKRTQRPIIVTTHSDAHTPAGEQRFEKARALLALYASAHCVITSRLHCALPSLALDTPVLLLDEGQDVSRFRGLHALVRRSAPEDFIRNRVFDLERPGHNPQDHKPLAAALEDSVAAFVRGERRGPNSEATGTSLELSLQTLVNVHADQDARFNDLFREAEENARTAERAALATMLEAPKLEIDALKLEIETLKSELQRAALDRAALEQTLTEREHTMRDALAEQVREKERAKHRLEAITSSATWRTALRIHAGAYALPGPLKSWLKTVLER